MDLRAQEKKYNIIATFEGEQIMSDLRTKNRFFYIYFIGSFKDD